MSVFDRCLATVVVFLLTFFSLREAQAVLEKASHRPDIVISVSGAVIRPGVLRLPAEARAIHAVEACGGLTAKADREALELARPLRDGDHLAVASRTVAEPPICLAGEPAPLVESSTSEAPSSVASERPDSSSVEKRPPRPRSQGSKVHTVERAAAPVDINRASLHELIDLPGVGPVLAQRIISARDLAPGGTFSSLEELGAIRGIKGKTLARLRPHLKLERQ